MCCSEINVPIGALLEILVAQTTPVCQLITHIDLHVTFRDTEVVFLFKKRHKQD